MVEIQLTRFRFGIVIGVLATLGVYSILQGLEVITFGGLLLEWTTQRAIFSIGIGAVNLMLAVLIYFWYDSVAKAMDVETESWGDEI